MKSGNLNFLEPSWPLQACNGTDLKLSGWQFKDALSKAQFTKRKGDFVIGWCERMWLEVVLVVSRHMPERAEETHLVIACSSNEAAIQVPLEDSRTS